MNNTMILYNELIEKENRIKEIEEKLNTETIEKKEEIRLRNEMQKLDKWIDDYYNAS